MSQTQQGQITIPGADTGTSGNIQQLLAANLGKEVVAEFVTGLDEKVRKSGVLTAVRTDYLVLFDDVNLVDIVCDLYSLKFITFYLPGTRRSSGATDAGSENGGSKSPAADKIVSDTRDAAPAMAALNYAKRKARKLD